MSIQVIFISGHDEFEYAQKAVEYGCRNYILKPITRQKINQIIDIIKSIAMEKGRVEKLNENMHNLLFESKIEHFLMDGNLEAIIDIINIDITKTTFAEAYIRNYYSFLLNIVFKYAYDFGLEQVELEDAYRKINSFLTLNECQQFVIQFYKNVLLFRNTAVKISEKIKKYIDSDYGNTELSVSFLASKLNLSVPYLSMIFKSETGLGTLEYIMNIRMQKAKIFLSESHISIKEIATRVGYDYSTSFIRAFTNSFGISPTEFRNKLEGEPK
jgi:two-component system response regulator YesN